MPCAAGELCQHLSDSTTTAELSCCGPCGGRLHRICGEIHNPDDDEDMNRICQSCATAKKSASSTSDRSNAAKRKEGGGFLKQNPPKKRQGEVRKRLTLGQKRDILKLLDQKVSRVEIGRRFNCGVSTVGDIKRDRATLQEDSAGTSWSETSKSRKGGDFPKVEALVMTMIVDARKLRIPVTGATIEAYGVAAKKNLLAAASTTAAEKKKLDIFSASSKWVKNLVLRNGIVSKVLHGEAGSVDADAIAEGLKNVEGEGGRRLAPPPPFSELSSFFGPLEKYAESCGISGTGYYLRKAKMSFIAARSSKPVVQADIRAMFSDS